MKRWELHWPYGFASIRSSAAILWECEFRLPSGRRFAPFARAPWANDASVDPSLPAHMRLLGGEFVCVPFGIGGTPAKLHPEWQSSSWRHFNRAPHGHSSNLPWEAISADSSHVALRLKYPDDDDIECLTRRVMVAPDAPALDLELTIHARRHTRQPVGLHPILRLPEWPEQVVMEASFEFGMTYPAFVPPGASRLVPGQRFSQLASIAGIHGEIVDYSTMPKQSPTEEMMMICKVRGPITLHYPNERSYFRLSWDTSILQSCLLWPSDRALADPPWNQSFRGLGIEPVAAVFDAAREVALESNPLNASGVTTAVTIEPGSPLTIRYRLEAGDDDAA
jgi:hypothetical protein